MHENNLSRAIQNNIAAQLAKVPAREARQVTAGECAGVRPYGPRINHPVQRAAAQAKCRIEPARRIAYHGEREVPEPAESPEPLRILEADYEHGGVKLVENALLVTQLRDVLSARDSAEPAQEDEKHGPAVVGRRRDNVSLQIHQLGSR